MGAGVESGPCPECGVENAADHNYCKNCGTPLGRDDGSSLGLNFAERMRDRSLELLRTQPDSARAHFDLGLSYYHLGQTGNATRAFERCLQIEDAYPAAHFQLCYGHQGLESLAMSSLSRALELDPSDAAAAAELQELQR
jgi:tetratricopeptide (TPR) repeat protein